MYQIISREIEKINAETAIEWLKFNTFQSQRNLREHHINYLAQKMLNKEFRSGEIAFAIMPDKVKYLMNGQHVLHATANSGQTIEAFVENFSCNNDYDLSRLFRQYDCNPVRSIGDMIRVEVDSLNLDWPYRVASLVVGAIFSLSGKHKGINRNSKVDMLRRHLHEGHFINRLFNGSKENRILERVPVVTAIIETWKKDQDEAFDFWTSIRDGEMLKKDMPQWKLRQFLTNAIIRGNCNYTSQYRTASTKEIRYRCILAWNAHRRGKSTNLSYHADRAIPKVV